MQTRKELLLLVMSLLGLLIPPVIIIIWGGWGVQTVSAAIAYMFCNYGYFTYIGGARTGGIVIIILGLIIGFIGVNWYAL